MFRFVRFLLQHRSHYKHQLPLCPPCRATEGNGNRQGRNEGLPKRSHTAPSPLKQMLELSGFCGPRWGYLAPVRRFPHTGPTSHFPLTLTPRHRGPPDSPGQRLTQQPHIRHGSSPPCQCWMVNRHKMSLLECVTEFRQRGTRKVWNEIIAIWWQ